MYRYSFTKILNNTSLIFSKSSTNTLCNVQKHNLKPLNKLPENSLLSNFRTSLSGRHSPYTTNGEYDETFSVLAKAYKEQGRVQAVNVFNIIRQRNVDFFTNNHSLLLLQCCGQAIVDKPPSERSSLCNQVWSKLQESVSLDVQHYNKYLEICIENRVKLEYLDFISKMKNCQPNEATYHLLLQCACQLGDISQAIQIVSEMKEKQFSADEKVFNMLILGNGIHGGLNSALKVLDTMQTARISPSTLTYFNLLLGIAEHKNYEEFLKALQIYPDQIYEPEFLKLLQVLGLQGNHIWTEKVLEKIKGFTFTKQGLLQLNLLCIHLVHMQQVEAGIYYYKKFCLPFASPEVSRSSVFLFSEMLSSGMPSNKVIGLIKDLGDIDQKYIIQQLTEVVLRKGLIEAAWHLFGEMQYLRPHYFWPILLRVARDQRENGIFAVISKMFKIGVKPDIDTLEFYIIPYCDTSDPKNLLLRLKHLGFSYKDVLTPILSYLLKEKQVVEAEKLCMISENIMVDSERLMPLLCRAWINLNCSKSAVTLLQRMCLEKENDHILGRFLLRLFKMCKSPANYNNFLKLVKILQEQNMKISTASADSIFYYLNNFNHRTLTKSVQTAIEAITDGGLDRVSSLIPHPKDMSINDLENHLTELQNKSMETRGVLRKLIQNHSRLGNEERVHELRQQFLDAGYTETAGMKAALFHSYINQGNDVCALNIYNEIKVQHPDFLLDDFKIIDFATLLIKNNKYDVAIKLLSESRANIGGPVVIRNCWHLLNATDDEDDMENLYQLLLDKGYCEPSNVILGPFVKLQLKRGNLEKAIEVYSRCVEKHKCTPYQVELIRKVVESENEELLHEVVNITSKVYGSDATAISLVSALSQTGYHKALRKLLLEMSKIPKYDIIRLCDRWIQCKDVSTLTTLAKAVFNFPPEKFDETIVYNYLIQLYGVNNDCESAVNFYRQLLELKVPVNAKLTQELLRMVHRCNYIVSEDLLQEQLR